ncbi:Uma2 family endonuclease [Deinococcus antarcticus]|uniref:Uma2 family endonuclease n=1 Tax=Deinococcus antarcticus TaxID=1298767 RepID=A0ABV8A5U5_9DEIO
MSEPAFQRMSAEEYLRTERDSPVKREFVDGFVYPLHAQAGASKTHTRLTLRIGSMLENLATERGCRPYVSDMKLMASAWRTFYYPDVMVCCGPDNPEQDFEVDACLLIEVLSPSTAAHDRTGKFAAYTALPGLQTYLLVEQTQPRIYAYQRTEGDWELTEYESGEIPLPCLDAGLNVERVYRGLGPS